MVEDLLYFEWGPLSFDHKESYLCFIISVYLQVENPNDLKHIINNNTEQTKLSFMCNHYNTNTIIKKIS